MASRAPTRSLRRDDIVAAARDLLRQSDAGFSMRTLAEQAGVSIATPYNVFGSKQGVLLAVLDDDLAEYQRALAALNADAIEVLFEAVALVTTLLAREPRFYRNVLAAVSRDGGAEFRFMVSGPRYVVWKRLLRQATEAGLLVDRVDPDAFAITTSQLMAGNITAWAQGLLTLEEMAARNQYGLALTLLAVATEASRAKLESMLADAEAKLQRHWQAVLAERLRKGTLDQETREILADQLKYLNSDDPKEASA